MGVEIAGVLLAWRRGLLHLYRKEHAILLQKHIDFLFVVRSEEMQRSSPARIEEALVDLAECVRFENLPAHGTDPQRLGTAPPGKIRRKTGIEKMHDGLLAQSFLGCC